MSTTIDCISEVIKENKLTPEKSMITRIELEEIFESKYRELITREEIEMFFDRDEKSHEVLTKEINSLKDSVDSIRDEIKPLNSLFCEIKEIIEVVRALKVLANIVAWFGKIAKPLLWIAGLGTLVLAYFQGIKIPKITQ